MAAIISDNLRILNAKNFLAGVSTSDNSYYAYVGLPNPTDYDTSWETSPPSPMESFNQLNNFWDTAIAMKKISSDDIRRVVHKFPWVSGTTYDMYRNDITVLNVALPSNVVSLYDSQVLF